LLPVRKKQNHIAIWKQRATLMLVLFFCMLISGAEYLPQHISDQESPKKESSNSSEQSAENQTFLNVAVDAVVPFVTVVGQQIFHLIYETITFEKPGISGQQVSVALNIPFWEILLERIISTNAP
jgi:hypothetical protein